MIKLLFTRTDSSQVADLCAKSWSFFHVEFVARRTDSRHLSGQFALHAFASERIVASVIVG